MTNIVVVFSKPEEARGIKTILSQNGFHVTAVCTTGAQAISQTDALGNGIVVCGYKLIDMMYSELKDYLPEGFEMLLIASGHALLDVEERDMITLSMPLKVHDLIETVDSMVQSKERQKRRLRNLPKIRKPEEEDTIQKAKAFLMGKNHISEDEAHKYLQKCSMDSGTNMVETAQMVLAMK